MPSTPPPALPDRYRIIRELGRGGMATVHLAEDAKHHRRVAIKVLHPDLSAAIGADRFLREIELTANLQHPHILPLFDSGESGGLLYYVMPYVEGESLRDRLDRDGRLPVADALAIAADVAGALTWAHGHGVVHRDIKPENILLSGGEALVADFGIALALTREDGERLTGTGLSLGTPAYMSPEQISGGRLVDGRSDVYALGCVLHEMLTGAPPFTGGTAQSILAQALVEPPPKVRAARPEVPAAVEAALLKALAKQPADRFDTPKQFVDACAAPAAAPAANRRSPWLVAAGAAVVLAAVVWPLWRSQQVARARASLPRVEALAAAGRYREALDLVAPAERLLPRDSAVTALVEEVTDLLTVTSEPSGASVYLQRLPEPGEPMTDSVLVGRTPLDAMRIARAEYRLSLQLEGRVPVERMVSSAFARWRAADPLRRVVTHAVTLRTPDEQPREMVEVPGGRYTLVSNDLPLGLEAELRPFFLDRFEVSNDRYREFARSGAAPAGFLDRTGMRAPRDWTNQEPPAGTGAHPVTGVSWVEASAYCAAQGKRLPTLYEWEKATRDGRVSTQGTMMPWGLMSAAVSTEGRANFAGVGTVPVDAHPFGLGPSGAYALAGNAKEWLANPIGGGRAFAGGSWQDPAYLFQQVGELPATAASAAIGFRCAKDAQAGAGDQGAGPVPVATRPPVYRPVDAPGHRALLAFYRYDRRPANPRGLTATETEDWRRERYWIDGPGGDSLLVYLFLPTRAAPPHQTILYVPSTSAFFYESVPRLVEEELGPHIKSGRAVMAVVMTGMLERPHPPGWRPPEPSSVGFRDLMVRHATQFRMAVDHLVTRADVDSARLAYMGFSWGAGSRVVFASVEDRHKAVVLIGAGIDERVQPTLPEAANFNFVPYIRQPKLMVNGRQDEEHRWLTRAKPMWDLMREPKELVLIDEAGHHPPVEQRVRPVNDFLDRVLGPVRPVVPPAVPSAAPSAVRPD